MSPTFKRVDHLGEVEERRPVFLAVGVFDGVHRGHQQLLQSMVAGAHEAGVQPAVLTFFPHPKVVIQGLEGRLYLTTVERRVQLLAEQGVELVIVHPFNEQVRTTRAAQFVENIDHHLELRQLWGGTFSLGHKREGDAPFLRRLGQEMGFTVHEFNDLVQWQGERVSSSRIREALAYGDMDEVNGCLGRPYQMTGEVVQSDQRGRTIGFPTANLAVWEQQLLPANGVYAAYAHLGSERFLAATNIGVRPTVGDERLMVEAFLLGFDREIYGEELTLEFVSRVRDEQKFPGLDALKAQILADVKEVRRLLAAE